MPSFIRLALHTVLFFVLDAFSPVALATPLSNPLPLIMPRYTSPSYYYIPRYTNESDITPATPISRSFPVVFPVSPGFVERDDVLPNDQRAPLLVQTFKALAAESRSPADKTSFTEDCLAAIELLLKILLQLKDASKGGRFRNNQDALQIYIKDTVDASKECLTYLYQIVECSGLGPVLGPVVYELKCLLDGLLDGAEDAVDLLLNLVGLDAWKPVIDVANDLCSLCGETCA